MAYSAYFRTTRDDVHCPFVRWRSRRGDISVINLSVSCCLEGLLSLVTEQFGQVTLFQKLAHFQVQGNTIFSPMAMFIMKFILFWSISLFRWSPHLVGPLDSISESLKDCNGFNWWDWQVIFWHLRPLLWSSVWRRGIFSPPTLLSAKSWIRFRTSLTCPSVYSGIPPRTPLWERLMVVLILFPLNLCPYFSENILHRLARILGEILVEVWVGKESFSEGSDSCMSIAIGYGQLLPIETSNVIVKGLSPSLDNGIQIFRDFL